MKAAVLMAVFALGCSADEPGEFAPSYETLLDEGFTAYPSIGWAWFGQGNLVADTNFGYPAPSAFLRDQTVSPPVKFSFVDQGIDARVTAYLQGNMMFGEQYATFELVDDFETFPSKRQMTVAYRLVDNRQPNLPIPGFPAGQSAQISCTPADGSVTTVPVPYENGAVAYDLFFTVDAAGTHCGYDDTVIVTTTPTTVTGVYRALIGSTTDSNAWFDNLVVRRAL